VSKQQTSPVAGDRAPEGELGDGTGELHPIDTGVASQLLESVQDSVVSLRDDHEAAYVWQREPDHFAWEANASKVFGVRTMKAMANRYQFELLIAPEHVSRRQHIFSTNYGEDLGQGVPYCTRYRFVPSGPRSRKCVWVEERGRWWADQSGNPVRARGRLRIMPTTNCNDDEHGVLASDYDELTGQLNRIRLTSALDAVIKRTQNSTKSSAFLIAAVSNLSIINDTFGFDVGDEVIASVANVLSDKLRSGDSIGRYSSNKFGIVLNECSPSAMRIAAQRLIRAISETTSEEVSCPIPATLAVGGVIIPDHASNVNDALSRALEALNSARSRRFSSFVAHEPNADKETRRQHNIFVAEEIRHALDDDRMHLMLQPIVASDTREPAFYECLMRMTEPSGAVVSAGEFIEIAEQLGVSKQIDRRTVALAASVLKADPDMRLSLNVSGNTCADHDWLLDLYALVSNKRELASRLMIEITETAAIHDLDQSIVFVDTLKEMGCKVAIDDFGAGYTSFKNLKHLPVDIVKIDGAFVRNLATDASDRLFLRTMVQLARNFGMETVAEWVIDEETAKIATDCGIDYLQGFHLGRPVAPEDVSNGLKDR
jgi:diguanylate cyclase (GGDEF)-like protein